jgi:hypothetical protein
VSTSQDATRCRPSRWTRSTPTPCTTPPPGGPGATGNRQHTQTTLVSVGRNKGSRTGVVVTVPVTCSMCGTIFQVLGKRRPDGPRPAKYCSSACYHASQVGRRPPGFIAKPGGAPKGRVPWNAGKKCPQLSGERNGMYGRTHTPEVRERLSAATSTNLSTLARARLVGAVPPLRRSDDLYRQLFRIGWRTIRRRAIERDNGRCLVCNTIPRVIEVHHVIPFGIVLKHELWNLATLCASCHTRVHRGDIQLVVAPDMAPNVTDQAADSLVEPPV